MQIDPTAEPSGAGCQECESAGAWWFHLRRCASCGHIGCCDSSPHQHARAHVDATAHQVITSFEPGEDWFYDFVSDDLVAGAPLRDPQSHPLDQTVPGPSDRVPPDWEDRLG